MSTPPSRKILEKLKNSARGDLTAGGCEFTVCGLWQKNGTSRATAANGGARASVPSDPRISAAGLLEEVKGVFFGRAAAGRNGVFDKWRICTGIALFPAA